MSKHTKTHDLRLLIDKHSEDLLFFRDLHKKTTNSIQRFQKTNFLEIEESELTKSIRLKLTSELNIAINGLKHELIDALLQTLDLNTFTSHIKLWNYYSSVNSYSDWFFQQSHEIFNQLVFRLNILIESHDRFYKDEIATTKGKKKITYLHLFNSNGNHFVLANFNEVKNIYMKAISFNRGFYIDEMKLLITSFEFRKIKFEEILNMSNKISLVRRQNICRSELKNIWYWKTQMGIEFPSSINDIVNYYIQTLRKLNLSYSERRPKEVFYKSGHSKYHAIQPNMIKKCHNLLFGAVTRSTREEFEEIFLNKKGKINWIGSMKQLLYFSKCLKEINVINRFNFIFIYRHFTLNNEEIIEDNNYKSELSKLNDDTKFLERNFFIKKATSFLS